MHLNKRQHQLRYQSRQGLLDVADQIPAEGSKLMPDDIDQYIASQGGTSSGEAFDQVDLPQSQIVLNYRLSRGTQVCVPVTVMSEIEWGGLEQTRAAVKEQGGPTAFAMCCWSIVQAMKKHDKFRSALTIDGKALKVFKRINIGVAVALPGEEMVTAVIRGADEMDQATFFKAFVDQVLTARDGKDQADESTTITISNIGKAGMRIGIPAIVAPAVATLAIGETYSHPVPSDAGFEFKRMVIATLCFDHRIANGVGAANFMNEVKSGIESFAYSG